MSDIHKHRCGWGRPTLTATIASYFVPKRAYRYPKPVGCGLVIEHDGDLVNGVPGMHKCPRCGNSTVIRYYGKVKPGKGVIKMGNKPKKPPKPTKPGY